jgi:hypothetical protein
MWDKNKDPEGLDDLEWDDLTPLQQEAAKVLGYDQKAWDES